MSKKASQEAATDRDALGRPKGRPPGGKRRSRDEVMARDQIIRPLALYGAPRADIMAALEAKSLGMPVRTLDEYLKRLRAEWQADSDEQRATWRAQQIRRLSGQIRQLQSLGRHRDVLERERLLAQIQGNLAPVQMEIGPKRRGWESLNDDELERFRQTGELPEGVSYEDLDRVN